MTDFSQLIQSAVESSSAMEKGTGLDKGQLIKGLGAILPEITGQLNRNAKDPEQRRSLDKALKQHENDDVKDPGSYLDRFDREEADRMSGHIFGNGKDRVIDKTKEEAGISSDQAKKLMLMAVPLVMAFFANRKKENNISEEELPKKTERMEKETGGGLLDSLTGLLDKNDDGNIVDDIIGFGK